MPVLRNRPLPLPTDEWGCPNEEKFYHYMKSYSPVDNVSPERGPYPPLLIKGVSALLTPPGLLHVCGTRAPGAPPR